jgi:hypothetical protein
MSCGLLLSNAMDPAPAARQLRDVDLHDFAIRESRLDDCERPSVTGNAELRHHYSAVRDIEIYVRAAEHAVRCLHLARVINRDDLQSVPGRINSRLQGPPGRYVSSRPSLSPSQLLELYPGGCLQ